MPRANAQPVRLSNDVVEAAKKAASRSGRSLPMEIEHRVQESLQRGAWAEVERQITPDARALGRLTSFLANEPGSFGQTTDAAQNLRAALGRLIDRMYATAKLRDPKDQAEMAADYWWSRMMNAEERTYEQGAPMQMTTEQRALQEIRADVPDARRPLDARRSPKERK